MAQTRFSGPVKSDNGFIFGATPEVGPLSLGQMAWSVQDGTFDVGLEYGVSIGSPASRIVVSTSGLYKFDFSLQVESNSASAKKMWIWPRINGSDVPDSNSEITVSGSGTVLVPSWSWTLSMNAGQYFEMMFAGDSVDILITSKAATSGANGDPTFARPAVPGVILDVIQVQQ